MRRHEEDVPSCGNIMVFTIDGLSVYFEGNQIHLDEIDILFL